MNTQFIYTREHLRVNKNSYERARVEKKNKNLSKTKKNFNCLRNNMYYLKKMSSYKNLSFKKELKFDMNIKKKVTSYDSEE